MADGARAAHESFSAPEGAVRLAYEAAKGLATDWLGNGYERDARDEMARANLNSVALTHKLKAGQDLESTLRQYDNAENERAQVDKAMNAVTEAEVTFSQSTLTTAVDLATMGSTKAVCAAGKEAAKEGAELLAGKAAQSGKQTTVLGENMMDRVIPYARKTGGRELPFGTTPEEWARMSPRDRYKLNDGTLRSRLKEGDNIESIGRDPRRPEALRKKFDLTGAELLRLKDRGVPVREVPAEVVKSVIGRP
ncbi:MAG: hypothetical protein ACK5Q4_00355 [Phycisphaerae bacterium]